MANIILTQKDADWVASIIRSQLQDLEEAYVDALKEGNKRSSIALQMAHELFADDEEVQKSARELEETKAKAMQALNNTYNRKKTAYTKIVELMLCGSEISESIS